MIIDPIDGTEEFTRGIPTFGTLLAVEEGGEIVAAVVSAPGLRSRWWAYRGEGAFRDGKKLTFRTSTSSATPWCLLRARDRAKMPPTRQQSAGCSMPREAAARSEDS